MTIRALIFDVGGVLLHLPHRTVQATWEQRLGLPPHAIGAALWGSEIGRQATLGRVAPEEVWAAMGRTLDLTLAQVALIQETCFADEELDPVMVALLQRLRPHYRLALLTNAWRGGRHVLTERFPLAPLVDDIVISAEVGLAKPDPAIYRLALDRLEVAPHEALFVDDKERNTRAAANLGIVTVCFETTPQTIGAIERLLMHHAANDLSAG